MVDLLVDPTLTRGDQILALPTLIRRLPPPVKKIIERHVSHVVALVGDLLDVSRITRGMVVLQRACARASAGGRCGSSR